MLLTNKQVSTLVGIKKYNKKTVERKLCNLYYKYRKIDNKHWEVSPIEEGTLYTETAIRYRIYRWLAKQGFKRGTHTSPETATEYLLLYMTNPAFGIYSLEQQARYLYRAETALNRKNIGLEKIDTSWYKNHHIQTHMKELGKKCRNKGLLFVESKKTVVFTINTIDNSQLQSFVYGEQYQELLDIYKRCWAETFADDSNKEKNNADLRASFMKRWNKESRNDRLPRKNYYGFYYKKLSNTTMLDFEKLDKSGINITEWNHIMDDIMLLDIMP